MWWLLYNGLEGWGGCAKSADSVVVISGCLHWYVSLSRRTPPSTAAFPPSAARVVLPWHWGMGGGGTSGLLRVFASLGVVGGRVPGCQGDGGGN